MTEKIVGYTLLGIGILVIIFTAGSVFMVFTGKILPIQLFNLPAITLSLAPGTKPVELMTADAINQTSNLAGQKLASLGVQLVRPIVIKAKEG